MFNKKLLTSALRNYNKASNNLDQYAKLNPVLSSYGVNEIRSQLYAACLTPFMRSLYRSNRRRELKLKVDDFVYLFTLLRQRGFEKNQAYALAAELVGNEFSVRKVEDEDDE